MSKRRVVITGMGFITSIGNDRKSVSEALREGKTGIEYFDEFSAPNIPVKLAGTVKGFRFPTPFCDDWEIPEKYKIPRIELRSMSPNVVYGYAAVQDALEDAKLTRESISEPRTGMMCASGGSMWMAYENLHTMETRGVQRCYPLGIVASIPGTLNINLVASYKIKGASLGFTSACASSAHALGWGMDLIRLNRQDRVIVVGAEDCNRFSILPFAAIRALSIRTDPEQTPSPFDVDRDGFVGTGGATALVIEELNTALARGADIYAELLGWGEASDGYNITAPDPDGDGLARAMQLALADAGIQPEAVHYINAHATGTPGGDIAELRAIKKVFTRMPRPFVSSTKSITGHGLSLAGAMEAGFTCLALKEGFLPVSAHIRNPDPEAEGIPLVTEKTTIAPQVAISNSSGFGGTNVTLVFRRWEE
ncbi:MAG: beta-ketoacyl-[acyl-carrier-protein] synthase family protein [Methylacidiphilales bacterium]|nr:beta-ketoacyl-[acyl-carrier-protein] synthase family protein [Candidatus Methylacidiphilales bacterium]MDW8349766.1 beta-ketoacyl-[acyl-carrier-protein] synthase family protein [Verrucomicrobiae bacterium]